MLAARARAHCGLRPVVRVSQRALSSRLRRHAWVWADEPQKRCVISCSNATCAVKLCDAWSARVLSVTPLPVLSPAIPSSHTYHGQWAVVAFQALARAATLRGQLLGERLSHLRLARLCYPLLASLLRWLLLALALVMRWSLLPQRRRRTPPSPWPTLLPPSAAAAPIASLTWPRGGRS